MLFNENHTSFVELFLKKQMFCFVVPEDEALESVYEKNGNFFIIELQIDRGAPQDPAKEKESEYNMAQAAHPREVYFSDFGSNRICS